LRDNILISAWAITCEPSGEACDRSPVGINQSLDEIVCKEGLALSFKLAVIGVEAPERVQCALQTLDPLGKLCMAT
tara:strand:- start:430 stop:657 length:228 start_codon:yes stop_codon:yes gene_type:complete